jgi:hypothetical protein
LYNFVLREFKMDIPSGFITPGIIFLLALASGLWLRNVGKPLNIFIFTIHKLFALAALIFSGMAVYNFINNTQIQFLIAALIVLAALCAVLLFVTGTLMSMDKPVNDILLTVHTAAPFLAVISILVTIYLSPRIKL